ncbi:Unknown protein, partial [Striga hermonthica]
IVFTSRIRPIRLERRVYYSNTLTKNILHLISIPKPSRPKVLHLRERQVSDRPSTRERGLAEPPLIPEANLPRTQGPKNVLLSTSANNGEPSPLSTIPS